MSKKPASVLFSVPARNLKHGPIWGSEVIPAGLARTLNGSNELNPCCFHARSCCIDIVHPEGDDRTGGEKRVKWLLGAIEFHLRPIGQLEPRNFRFVSNGLHAHHTTKELDHLFKLSRSHSQPSESFDMHSFSLMSFLCSYPPVQRPTLLIHSRSISRFNSSEPVEEPFSGYIKLCRSRRDFRKICAI